MEIPRGTVIVCGRNKIVTSQVLTKVVLFLLFILCRPCIRMPAPSKPVVAVRFCPAIFSLVENVPEKETISGKFLRARHVLYSYLVFFLTNSC
jgi:hypothetical protein